MEIYAIAIAKKGTDDFEILKVKEHVNNPQIEIYIKKPGSGSEMSGVKTIDNKAGNTKYTKIDEDHDTKLSAYNLKLKEFISDSVSLIVIFS